MAASKRNAPSDDELDWTLGDKRSPKKGTSALILIGAGALLILLAAGFVLWRHDEAEQRRADEDWARAAEQDYHEVEHRRKAERQHQAGVVLEEFGPIPMMPGDAEEDLTGVFDFREDLAKIKNPRVLDYRGHLLLQFGQVDRAVEAFRRAAELDPMYANDLEMAQKKQAQRDRTAPPPREVEQP